MVKKLQFLCGKKIFVYGVRFPMGSFYYFDKLDSILTAHVTLPAELGSIVTSRKQVIEVELNEEQLKNYWKNEKFVFKNKALKTYVNLAIESRERENNGQEKDLKFIAGETDPILFLVDFEKCFTALTDQEKTRSIQKFVTDEHEDEFNQYCYNGSWLVVRKAFIKTFAAEKSPAEKCGLGKRIRKGGNGRGRLRKRNLTSIPEDESCGESEDFTFLNEMSSSSNSTWSDSSGSSSNLSSLK